MVVVCARWDILACLLEEQLEVLLALLVLEPLLLGCLTRLERGDLLHKLPMLPHSVCIVMRQRTGFVRGGGRESLCSFSAGIDTDTVSGTLV